MQKKNTRKMFLQKENNRKNVNKRDNKFQGISKVDRLPLVKRIPNGEEKEDRELKLLKNTKEVRVDSKLLPQKSDRLQLISLLEPLNNTQNYCQLYAHELIQRSEQSSALGSFLAAHDIDKNLRARMLDWMIEVVSSYKFTAKTYFASVQLMDRYFKAEGQALPIARLHIIGVVAMLIATKMDEVFPLKLKTVYDKIVHRKIEKKDLIDMEAKIAEKLDFKLNMWSFYDLAILKLHANFRYEKEEGIKKIEELCQYIAKCVVFNYQLCGCYSNTILANALLKAASKIYGSQRLSLALENQGNQQTRTDQKICLQLILDTVKSFKKTFSSLNNIHRFGEHSVLEKVETFFESI